MLSLLERQATQWRHWRNGISFQISITLHWPIGLNLYPSYSARVLSFFISNMPVFHLNMRLHFPSSCTTFPLGSISAVLSCSVFPPRAGSFPEQRLIIEPTFSQAFAISYDVTTRFGDVSEPRDPKWVDRDENRGLGTRQKLRELLITPWLPALTPVSSHTSRIAVASRWFKEETKMLHKF